VSVPQGELSSTVGQFFDAYLAGAGEVERYLAPGVRLSAVSPAPYNAVTVRQVLAVEDTAAAKKVPGDETTVRVLAHVEARDKTGRWPLAYELDLKARSGRWDVATLTSAITQKEGQS
ncbi:conjugal transfer protein, partial [Streptomyces pilosus]